MPVQRPPEPLQLDWPGKKIFLAGTIDLGASEDWQTEVSRQISSEDVLVFNPRRLEWKEDWERKKENSIFLEQVTWELEALEVADQILLHFLSDSKSPISLVEFGLYARSGKLIVSCPEGFWRKGNVDIVCERYGVPYYESLDQAIASVVSS